jgi:transposase-like protein
MLRNWIKRYNSHGDFKRPNNGEAIYMAKSRKTTPNERVEIVGCIAANKDYGAAIEKYGVSYRQIYAWVRKYEQGGAKGLLDRRGKRKDAPCGGRLNCSASFGANEKNTCAPRWNSPPKIS